MNEDTSFLNFMYNYFMTHQMKGQFFTQSDDYYPQLHVFLRV